MDIKKMSKKELIQTNKKVFDMINNVNCYRVADVELENATAIELIKRGYESQVLQTIIWKKAKKSKIK